MNKRRMNQIVTNNWINYLVINYMISYMRISFGL